MLSIENGQSVPNIKFIIVLASYLGLVGKVFTKNENLFRATNF